MNDLSANAVMTTGSTRPGSIPWVWALNALQNSMMLRPRWPSAGPIGGDGFAFPAGTCSLMKPTIFFAMSFLFRVQAPCRANLLGSSSSYPECEQRETPGGARLPPLNQTFSTWAKSSSTGVARPKIVTATRTFDLS